MPPGGRRPGAGRPKGSKAKRHKVVLDEAMLSGLMPVDWMLAVLRDPQVEERRRDRMAEVLAPFLHPRLAAVELGHRKVGRAETVDVVQVFAVPRGARIGPDGVVIDGAAVEIEPFTPTPSLLELSDQTAVCAPPEPPLEVIEPADDNKVESLSAWRRRTDEEPP
jgi:hypothetical protein